VIRTERLILRRWVSGDRKPFAEMNSDREVMKHFPGLLSPEESDRLADRIEAHFVARGFGLWAVEIPGLAAFAGFVGLSVPGFEAPFTPCVEIGWRLARAYWGRGHATEAASAVLAFGFDELRLDQIVSFTAVGNAPSRRIMEKLGMTHDPRDDFDHPALPPGHPLQRHVLYRKVGCKDAA
jgi:RimJ/RimL family protein N-acetyltransferase